MLKFKLKEKFVCIKDFSGKNFSMQKDTVFKLGEACFESSKSMLDIYGDDHEINMNEETLKEASKYFVPLAVYREKRIDEILF